MLTQIKKDLSKVADPKRAKISQRFFKTGKGQYGEGDVFIGVTMPELRKVAKRNIVLSLQEVEHLLHSRIHEERMSALIIWTYQYLKGTQETKEQIYRKYLKNTAWINNWDLIDVTAPQIIGVHLLNQKRNILYTLARSKSLWERRIAIVATFTFIRQGEFKDTLKIAEILLHDNHDLIHKAVGWMLREVGKKDTQQLQSFLEKHYSTMPRTMLRYAIEKFPEKKRQAYLKGTAKAKL